MQKGWNKDCMWLTEPKIVPTWSFTESAGASLLSRKATSMQRAMCPGPGARPEMASQLHDLLEGHLDTSLNSSGLSCQPS